MAGKRELRNVFGSVMRVRVALVDQITAVPGISRALAERIKATLEADSAPPLRGPTRSGWVPCNIPLRA